MKRTIIVGTDTLLLMVKQLYNRGEITEEQYNEIVERNNKLSIIQRDDFIIDGDIKNE